MTLEAKLYDGVSSQEHCVEIHFSDDKRVVIDEFNLNEPIESVKISSRLGNTPRVIEFSSGIRVKCEDNDTIDKILNRLEYKKGVVHKLESSWKFAISSLAAIVFFTIFMLTFGADYSADLLASKLPQNTLDSASKKALSQLDKGYLHKSNLSNERKVEIIKLFNKLTNGDKHYKLHFRSSPKMGPNAFMLPSGDTILLDELVFLDKDPNLYGTLGVLAHEKGHYIYKHGLKSLIKGTIATTLVSYLSGDVTFLATTIPTILITSKYSRENEREADIYAKSELKRLKISSKPLANIFKELNIYVKKRGSKSESSLISWVSSHPTTKSRIDYFNKD